MSACARTISVVLAGLLVFATLNGCGSGTESADGEPNGYVGVEAENAVGETEDKGFSKPEQDSLFSECDYLGQEPPGDEPVIFAAGVVSTRAMEYRCVISPNGKEIFFNREAHIYYLEKKGDGSGWSGPAPAPFSGKDVDGESCLSSDGNRIYFSSRRPLTGAKQASNVWYCDRSDEGWGIPRPMDSPVNDQTVHALSVSASGDIYASGLIRLRLVDGKYLEPEKLTPDIKGYHPFVAPDEAYIIFDRPQQRGYASDLFIAFQKPDGTWSDPVDLGVEINTSAKESNASISPDGKYMFFSRAEDIFWVRADFIEKLRFQVR